MRVLVGNCPECGDLALIGPGRRCWMCGGWIGYEYPLKVALVVSTLLRTHDDYRVRFPATAIWEGAE